MDSLSLDAFSCRHCKQRAEIGSDRLADAHREENLESAVQVIPQSRELSRFANFFCISMSGGMRGGPLAWRSHAVACVHVRARDPPDSRASARVVLLVGKSAALFQQRNGSIERAIQTIQGQVRAIKDNTERQIGATMGLDSSILKWLVRHAASTLTTSHVGGDGAPTHQRQTVQL